MARLSETLRSAEGGALLWFCPGCRLAHQIHVGGGSGPRWTWNGDAERPTFSPSVKVSGTVQLTDEEVAHLRSGGYVEPKPLICHAFIVDGRIQFLGDCTHALAGQTVPIPPFHPDDEP